MGNVNRYEPEDIKGCMLMITNDDGRYVLKTDYDIADKKIDHLIKVIFSLQEDIIKLENKPVNN
tara:strand:+ start:720 stop:911 length:192 start_codon:yes stop_codon:yes gene_type:complete